MKFYYLGNFDGNGKSVLVNDGMEPDQTIDSILPVIKELLPEGYKLHHTHPEWLRDNSIDFQEETDVTITFVSEGAGYRNAVGYFIYPSANPPKTIGHIKRCYFFFPNTSQVGSGGALNPGDKIRLPFTFNYSMVDGREVVTPNSYTFHKNHSIGFILYPNGWKGDGVNEYITPYTSIPTHNPEEAHELKFHTACFRIPDKDRFIISFEDLRRDKSYCDHDFNDAVMVIDINPLATCNFYIDTKRLELEKKNPNVPVSYTIGFKKIFSTIDGNTVEAVATMYIPRSASVKTKSTYKIRLITSEAYIESITVVAPKTNRVITIDHVGKDINTGYSWYDNSFIYTVNTNIKQELDHVENTGIHFFRTFAEAAGYDYTPLYGM
jgi:hypothetical protein